MSSSTAYARRLVPILATLALTLAACGGGDSAAPSGSDQGGQTAEADAVLIEAFKFAPERISVAAGTEVTWTNQDSADHSIQDGGDLFAESEALAQGDTYSFTYDTPGEYPYICGIHPYMKGTVSVS